MLIGDVVCAAPVIPVIVLERAADAVPLARALLSGGLPVIEVTLRTDAALEAIRAIAREVPQAIVGAGTVRGRADLDAARDAGARFAVSPGATAELLAAGRESGLPLLPGAMTPSEVIAAVAAGYDTLKFFPAVQAGGVEMLKALAGPFPHVKFCPTGGISLASAPDYLALPNVCCVGGSWIAPPASIHAADWASITRLALQARRLRA
ncbi:MAG TPA: bifunctional 4-hydroxy-2-oxoglutarate aldolase/2-dehydro-3-deoxy-phosphogluconate aldolase [Burkholderiaceae bacterium]|jgi:2-dehydro-3-deoxyphosphogluconate aldolase/(4S)-4-hydroxy-2-oxoglutarate aldolase|nr:bifunctional 4-hydroxy-2-oxoglutarate aldolase/2-dehydro-3-deoxy-phosphogluconate aldolase [Burkholderiaceae bacterium]